MAIDSDQEMLVLFQSDLVSISRFGVWSFPDLASHHWWNMLFLSSPTYQLQLGISFWCCLLCELLVQVPHPLYRPTKSKLVPCVDQLCASLHGGLTGRHKCDSPHQQCDYEIRYADQGSSIGVLVNDSFAMRLANSSVVRPSLAFGYATSILRSVYNFAKSTASIFLLWLVPFVQVWVWPTCWQ